MGKMVITENLMQENKKMKTKRSLTIVLTVLLAIAVISTFSWAKKPVCRAGLAGTWVGSAGSDISWLAIHTSDSLDPTKGEMVMNWTHIDPDFLGGIKTDVTLTPAHGVWQLNDDRDYDYTWYAYILVNNPGSDDHRKVVGIVRANGVAMLHDPDDTSIYDCDQVAISYHLSFQPLDDEWDFSSVDWEENVINGWAYERRVPLVSSSPEE
jgi:hypothetical protein